MGLFGVTELFDPDAKVELMAVAVVPTDELRALDLHLDRYTARALRARRAQLAAETLRPIADRGRARPRQPRRSSRRSRPHGLLARLFERDHVSAIELCLIREALARGCTEAETAFALQGLGAYPIVQADREQLKAQWIPRVADGTAIAAFALTEPDAGSDPARAVAAARRPTEPTATG